MDQPGLAPEEHRRALVGLSRLNRISGSVRLLLPAIVEAARRAHRPLRILDLATGSGDLPLGLWRRARGRGLIQDILGVDISERAVEIARRRADTVGASSSETEVRFQTMDVLSERLPDSFDVIVASLFLHHLDESEAVALLAKMAAASQKLVLVNDLVRNRRNLVLVALGARLLTSSRVVHTDASLSVRAAFTVAELRNLAAGAGMQGASITRQFPCRMLLWWRKP
jgi:SAM-dependent methyltransferase